MTVVAVVGNPRPASRTHGAALALRDALAAELADADAGLVDLPELGAELLDPDSPRRKSALATTRRPTCWWSRRPPTRRPTRAC